MFDFALVEKELDRPRLSRPLPAELPSNRGERARVVPEAELNAMHREWFRRLEQRIAFLSEHGLEVGWLYEWAAKYTWSWLSQDMSRNHELYVDDLRYVDPTTFGRTLVGLDEFVDYNFAFLGAISDWRYDPFPDQMYIDVTPENDVRLVVRYMGSGFFDGTLRLYPYDESAPALEGNGAFIQGCATDRYHFNSDGLMTFGETLWDFMDMAQASGLAPRDDSMAFRTAIKAAQIPRKLGKRLRIGSR